MNINLRMQTRSGDTVLGPISLTTMADVPLVNDGMFGADGKFYRVKERRFMHHTQLEGQNVVTGWLIADLADDELYKQTGF